MGYGRVLPTFHPYQSLPSRAENGMHGRCSKNCVAGQNSRLRRAGRSNSVCRSQLSASTPTNPHRPRPTREGELVELALGRFVYSTPSLWLRLDQTQPPSLPFFSSHLSHSRHPSRLSLSLYLYAFSIYLRILFFN